ncbi:MAG: CoA transferase [Deltaproteobacteria bacterium]|nr:MAG: CoA transferase [Deltaproteobacteria bacterium]
MSMLDVALAFFWPDGMLNHTLLGEGVMTIPPLATIYRVYRARDGYITLAGLTDEEWRSVCRALKREDLIEDPRFLTAFDRFGNMDELRAELAGALAEETVAEWCRRLTEEDVAHAPILDLDEVAEHPQVKASGAVVESDHPSAGRVRQARPAARFEATGNTPLGHAPMPAEHTDEVLAEAGYGAAEIEALLEAGIVS